MGHLDPKGLLRHFELPTLLGSLPFGFRQVNIRKIPQQLSKLNLGDFTPLCFNGTLMLSQFH